MRSLELDHPSGLPIEREIDELRTRLEHLSGLSWYSGDVERELRSQSALLRTVLDESPDLIVLKDHEGNFLICNKPVADFYGATPDEMVGKHDGDYSATPEQAEFFRRNVIDIMARGETVVVLEDSTDERTGETRHFKSIKKPFIGEGGLPRILVIAHDMTDIHRAQLKLKESERRLSYVLNVTGEGVWDWDVQSNRLLHNQRWYDLLGYEKGDLSATIADFDVCLLEEDRDNIRAAIDSCLQGHGPYRHEHRMRRKDGTVIWVLDRGDVVERDAQGRPLRMVGSFSDVTERKMAEAETQRLAFFDSLTGLPNRRLALDRLDHAVMSSVRASTHGALLFFDLDNFKGLNDTKGHAAGDVLLKQVGQRLCDCLRQADTAGRMGGDEFVAIIENLDPDAREAATQAEAVATNLLRQIGMPYDIDGSNYSSTISIGIVLFGATSDTAHELMKRADFAMYQAKGAGRNTLRFYDPEMQEAVLARAALEVSLRAGLDRGEVGIYLQPVVDAQRHLVGAEALARWHHRERGLVSPAEFIPLAEQCGLIQRLGGLVLQAACEQLVLWSKNAASSNLKISVNVSSHQFHQADFVLQVTDIIDRIGVRADLLKLELTESVLLEKVEETIIKMTALKARGVCFSIDDFGTGFSSLAYLKRLPLDELKIDRSFVCDVLTDSNDASIVRTILALAQTFSLNVVAEGVETEGQRQFLVEHGCTHFQGYLFGRPMSVHDFAHSAA